MLYRSIDFSKFCNKHKNPEGLHCDIDKLNRLYKGLANNITSNVYVFLKYGVKDRACEF